MGDYKIRQIFEQSYGNYSAQGHFQSDVQQKAAHAILNCKSGKMGGNLSVGQRIEGDANDKLFFRFSKNRPRSLGANGRLTAIIRYIIGEY